MSVKTGQIRLIFVIFIVTLVEFQFKAINSSFTLLILFQINFISHRFFFGLLNGSRESTTIVDIGIRNLPRN